jgi:hypothetical protein
MLYIAADGVLANFGIESLKQLNDSASLPPSVSDTATVVAAAQFSVDAPGGQVLPQYVFDQDSGGNLGQSIRHYLHAPPNMTEQEALTCFLTWVLKTLDQDTDYYALILWSHGPELFLQPPSGSPTGASSSLYLTPVELREAIQHAIPLDKRNKLKIVAFDACSLSMVEMAYELRDLADYMVASQEEVPDLSFPYSNLIQLFRTNGGDVESLLRQGVKSYIKTYQDYIYDETTSMNPVTLSAFRLKVYGELTDGIKNLASALLTSKDDPDIPAYVLGAREKSRDFASGLYVDIVEFCTYLSDLLYPSIDSDEADANEVSAKSPGANSSPLSSFIDHKRKIREACRQILKALEVDKHGTSENFLLVNCSRDTRCHGVSIYFPFLSDEEASNLGQPMVKGTREVSTKGTREVPSKGFSPALNACMTGYLMDLREELILDTECYYDKLAFAAGTFWYDFITEVWTRILIEFESGTLDVRYSAVQSAINAIRKPKPASA